MVAWVKPAQVESLHLPPFLKAVPVCLFSTYLVKNKENYELAGKFGVTVTTIRRWKLRGILVNGVMVKPRPSCSWNKGKTQSAETRAAISLKLKGNKNTLGYKHTPETLKILSLKSRGRRHTDSSRKLISERMKVVGGGYRPGSGRGIKGFCLGIWCDSSWEAALVVWASLHGFSIKKNYNKFPLEGGVLRSYIPDFILDGKLVEVKGYESNDSRLKRAQYPDIAWYGKEKMTPILEEVKSNFNFSEFIKNSPRTRKIYACA